MTNVVQAIQNALTWLETQCNASWVAATISMMVGFVLLLVGGNVLVSGASGVARRLGIPSLIIGLTIVAAGTSAPELFLNLAAALDGATDLCFGNIVGSNIANVGLVLGIGGLITPLVVPRRVIRNELPWMIGVSAMLVVFVIITEPGEAASTRGIGRLGGLIYFTIFLGLILAWVWMCVRDETPPEDPDEILPTWAISLTLLILGMVLLPLGGEAARAGAVGLATAMNVPNVVIGLTIVALATSLPEVATTIAACRQGKTDLAVGNVVGSNLFNLLLVMGLTATVNPVALPAGGWLSMGVMIGIALLLIPLAMTNQRRITRGESLLLLAIYAGYMIYLVV
ncbi:MAG: calcium/sodium antiporter [Planctomycetota bacterium]